VTGLAADLRYAVRTLAKSPGFTAIAVLTLGLGIGATSTVFTSVNALLLRPYPYRDQSRVMALREDKPSDDIRGNEVSYPNFVDWRAESRSFDDLAAYSGRSMNVAGGDEPELVRGEEVSDGTFRLLGMAPIVGRDFQPEEGRPGGPGVVLLSHGLWQRRFGGDRAIVGRPIQLNGVPTTVVGIMPEGFAFPGGAQLWVPLQRDATTGRGNHWLEVVGRLRPGVSNAQAHAELGAIAGRLAERFPDSNRGWTVSVVPLREHEIGSYRPVLYIMLGAVLFVLLIACANVANLQLARGAARQREIAVRTALGASRSRIVRQLLTESVVLALLGALIGLAFALWGNDLVNRAVPADRPFWMRFTIDGRVLAFTAGVAVLTGLLFGSSPALQAARGDLHESLKEGGRGGSTGRRHARLRSAFVVGEVALSLVLVLGATLLIRSFVQLQTAPIGFDRSHLLTVSVNLAGPAFDSSAQRQQFLAEAQGRLRALPGVSAAAAASSLPLTGDNTTSNITVEGVETPPESEALASWQTVTGEYFRALGLPVVRGRAISERDVSDSARVAVVNETMARLYWPHDEPVGKRFHLGTQGTWITVIGVARDVQRRLTDPPQNQFYLPYPHAPFRYMTILVRTTGEPGALAPAVRRTLRAAAPSLGLYNVRTMDEWFRQAMWESRLYGQMFGMFALVALLLASLGVYGVVAYMVAQRTHEIGVRMALGARAADVLRLVVRSGIGLTSVGVVLGIAGAAGMTGVLRRLLFGVSATDPFTFVTVPLFLLGVALLACYLPARRAARVDPVIALRYE